MNPLLLFELLILAILIMLFFRPAWGREEVANADDEKAPTVQDIAAAEVAAMTPAAAPKGITEAEISAKVAVGLTRSQAIEVLERQAAEDAAAAKASKKKG